MDNTYLGIIGFAVLLFLLGLGIPVAVALVLPGIIGLIYLMGVQGAFNLFPLHVFSYLNTFEMTAIPLFLLMGYAAMHTGLVSSAYDAARIWFSKLPGGLAMATCVASGLFGACAGSGVPATVALGRMATPEMLRFGYNKGLAVGSIVAAATVAVLIPPSILMVIYAVSVETSLGKLLLAGYIPGMLSVILFVVMIGVRVRLDPRLAPPITEIFSCRQRLAAINKVIGIVVLMGILLGGIYSGLFTATEAAALGAFAAFLIMIISKNFKWAKLQPTFFETIQICGMVFLLMMCAAVFAKFIAVTGLPQTLAMAISEMNLSVYMLIAVICVIYLFLGMFMDSISMLLLTIPVLLPILKALDINLTWFGIIYIKMTEIGAITPPFALGVFIIKGVVGDTVSMGEVFRGIWWFLIMEFATVALLVAFPAITLFLPNTMQG